MFLLTLGTYKVEAGMGDQTNILDDGDGIGYILGWREDKPT